MSKGREKTITGLLWGGFKGECNKEHCQHINPLYVIKKPQADGIYLCEILRAFLMKKVCITIKELP